jgi:hypothetical protein
MSQPTHGEADPGAHRPPRAVVLLGTQRFEPTLLESVRELGVKGKIATITAGWQEREVEDLDLQQHLSGQAVNLSLHTRANEVYARDKVLHDAHREVQNILRHKQDFYRTRLEHALDAHHVILQRKAPAAILDEENGASIASIRALDEYHLAQCERIHHEFDVTMRPLERESVASHRERIAEVMRDAEAVAIAGGHVATLLNRMRLFGIAQLINGHAVFAWSGGAMVVSDRVVLFHDSPPQGAGFSEVLDAGLGLCPGVVPLPHPETRLRLDDAEKVGLMSRRFAPSVCLALPARSRATCMNGAWSHIHGAVHLHRDGTTAPFTATPLLGT